RGEDGHLPRGQAVQHPVRGVDVGGYLRLQAVVSVHRAHLLAVAPGRRGAAVVPARRASRSPTAGAAQSAPAWPAVVGSASPSPTAGLRRPATAAAAWGSP